METSLRYGVHCPRPSHRQRGGAVTSNTDVAIPVARLPSVGGPPVWEVLSDAATRMRPLGSSLRLASGLEDGGDECVGVPEPRSLQRFDTGCHPLEVAQLLPANQDAQRSKDSQALGHRLSPSQAVIADEQVCVALNRYRDGCTLSGVEGWSERPNLLGQTGGGGDVDPGCRVQLVSTWKTVPCEDLRPHHVWNDNPAEHLGERIQLADDAEVEEWPSVCDDGQRPRCSRVESSAARSSSSSSKTGTPCSARSRLHVMRSSRASSAPRPTPIRPRRTCCTIHSGRSSSSRSTSRSAPGTKWTGNSTLTSMSRAWLMVPF